MHRRFVWTPTGLAVHIAWNGADRTLCGRPVDDPCDAHDVLYFEVCQKCRRAVGIEVAA